jgi:transposase InsO family protein
MTYIPTREGWLYLAVVLDLFSRRIVGGAMGATIDAALACRIRGETHSVRNGETSMLTNN